MIWEVNENIKNREIGIMVYKKNWEEKNPDEENPVKTGINTARVECFQERVNAPIHEDLSELKPVLEVLVYRFHISAIVNNAAMNIGGVCIFWN